jgi:MGT family glycosyltransferase
VVTAPRVRTEVKGLGFDFIGLPRIEGVGGEGFRTALRDGNQDQRQQAVAQKLLEMAAVWTTPLAGVIEAYEPQVVLRETTSLAALFAGELTHTPVGTFDYALRPRGPIVDRVLSDQFAAFRRELGLPAEPDLAALNRWLTLAGAPPEWFRAGDLTPTTHLIQPPELRPWEGESVDRLVQSLDDRPLVWATLGTAFNAEPGVWPMVLEGLAEVDANVVATVGPDLDPAVFGPQPSHVRLERFISQALILPHCTATLTHGGYGSLMGALRHGLPCVVLPLPAGDNWRNATKVERLGAGIAIHEDSRSAGAVRKAVAAVLTEPSYQEAARRLAASIASLPPTSHGATLLERLARERQPIHS